MEFKQVRGKILIRKGARSFAEKTSYGNLSDQDRIFSNVYRDDEPWVDGALRRVNFRLIFLGGLLARRLSIY